MKDSITVPRNGTKQEIKRLLRERRNELAQDGKQRDTIVDALFELNEQTDTPLSPSEVDALVDESPQDESKDNQKVRLSEAELRDEILSLSELNQGVAYSGGSFRLYKDGVWSAAHDLEVRRTVGGMLQALSGSIDLLYTRNLEVNVTDLIRSKMYVREDGLNVNPGIIVFKNCALDTGTMTELEHSPEHMATTALPYEYDPEATAPTWEMVLGDAMSEAERGFLQEYAGYCLTTSVQHQIALWLYGPPGSSKSTLIAGFEAMLGDLAGALSLTQLGSRFGLVGIEGKTLLTCTEVPKQHVKATDVLNAMITGDTLQVEQKGKDAYDHRSTAKLLWSMNNLPGLFDTNNGLFRRVKVLELDAIPEEQRDPTVIERVRLEGPGIINWALEGLGRLNGRGRFDYPTSVLEATSRFKQDNDLPGLFLEERGERPGSELYDTKEFRVYAADLTGAFNEWAQRNGHGHRSTKSLAPEWERLGLRKGNRDKQGIPYHGIKLV